jgi:hypothetical protein
LIDSTDPAYIAPVDPLSIRRTAALILGGILIAMPISFAKHMLITTPIPFANQILIATKDSFAYDIAFVSFAIIYLAIIGVGIKGQTSASNAAARSPAPSWLRRLRWMLLGGLPGFVAMGVISHVAFDFSVSPFLWLLPTWLIVIAWVIAFARSASPSAMPLAWGVQLLALAPLAMGLCLAQMTMRNLLGVTAATPSFSFAVYFAVLSGILLMPHRFTLVGQFALVVAALVQIYGDLPSDLTTWAMLIHFSLSAITCWSCQGAAVKDLPPPDRRREFAFCVLAGFFGFVLLHRSPLPAILFPAETSNIPSPSSRRCCCAQFPGRRANSCRFRRLPRSSPHSSGSSSGRPRIRLPKLRWGIELNSIRLFERSTMFF